VNIFEDEVIDFMKLLNKNEVKYLLVGGIAVNYFGYSRTTGDVDLWIEDSTQNRQHLVNSLSEFGIEGADAFFTHPLIAGYSEILLGNGIYVDLMSNLVSLKQEQFNDCYQYADKIQFDANTQFPVLHFNKLIEEKTKTGRPKDLNDVEELTKWRAKQK
jgi:predicted nucleotidyltransferase